ncbi:hypothetical protein BH11ARM1_BH11ARM1_07020 [soil metagenome]
MDDEAEIRAQLVEFISAGYKRPKLRHEIAPQGDTPKYPALSDMIESQVDQIMPRIMELRRTEGIEGPVTRQQILRVTSERYLLIDDARQVISNLSLDEQNELLRQVQENASADMSYMQSIDLSKMKDPEYKAAAKQMFESMMESHKSLLKRVVDDGEK